MNATIDELVSQIHVALQEKEDATDQVGLLLSQLKLKGVTKAVELREVLIRYSNDETLPDADQSYAKEALEKLPSF